MGNRLSKHKMCQMPSLATPMVACGQKLNKKWQNFIKWPDVFFHGQLISKMAKCFEIDYQMANLATLVIPIAVKRASSSWNDK